VTILKRLDYRDSTKSGNRRIFQLDGSNPAIIRGRYAAASRCEGILGCSARRDRTKRRDASSRVLARSHRSVVVAVPLIWMMKVSFHEIVSMTAVRNCFMSASGSMGVLFVMCAARMGRGTRRRIRTTLGQGMFINMPLVSTVKMPVM
jgi:hypothetical protein